MRFFFLKNECDVIFKWRASGAVHQHDLAIALRHPHPVSLTNNKQTKAMKQKKKNKSYGSIINSSAHHELTPIGSRDSQKGTMLAVATGLLLLILLIVAGEHERTSVRLGEKSSSSVDGIVRMSDSEDDYNEPRFYHHQIINHFTDQQDEPSYWTQRYYQDTRYYEGPGHPIFLVVGGEGAVDDGFLYPFVNDILAKRFGAAVVEIEHRFYGPFVPLENATYTELLELLTPRQAMADMVQLITHLRTHEFECSESRISKKHYCPIVTVGASYPGFLSALFRIMYPDVVDISYASSAPLLMYAQATDSDVYYDIVTDAAERTLPGCADAVRETLQDTINRMEASSSLVKAAEAASICGNTIPEYIQNSTMLQEALVQMASFAFANANMDNYPPSKHTSMYKICKIFLQDRPSFSGILKDFLFTLLPTKSHSARKKDCFDICTQLPKGPNTTLEDTDGEYNDGLSWDFQTCTDIIFVLSFSNYSMFPTVKPSGLAEMERHCRERFGVTPRPYELVDRWGFDDLSDASYILFTNGLQDMWSGGSYLHNVSDTVVAFNFENGAHHSDLQHSLDMDKDTKDIRRGYKRIEEILGQWLDEIKYHR